MPDSGIEGVLDPDSSGEDSDPLSDMVNILLNCYHSVKRRFRKSVSKLTLQNTEFSVICCLLLIFRLFDCTLRDELNSRSTRRSREIKIKYF